ncbi:MAG: 16S rRNA (adenine(1518)-N(6)/adenine(1519)-N(6))-dimethyltransferase RsmA [Patescibacteria group bacterium]
MKSNTKTLLEIRPNKLLGQHFLRSRQVLQKIIAAAELSQEKTVLEIGPGLGTLTRALAKRAGLVVAVEKDQRLAEQLEKSLASELIANVRVVRGDILKINFADLKLPPDYSVVANIPYYLTSRLLRTLLESKHPPREMILTVQKEVAERIVAKPPKMNLLAVSVQAFAKPKILFTVPPSAFYPPPAVDSALIKLSSVSEKFFTEETVPPDRFFQIVRAGFQARRKTLANNLARYLGNKKAAEARLEECGIDPRARAETLPLKAWTTLTRKLCK